MIVIFPKLNSDDNNDDDDNDLFLWYAWPTKYI